MTRRDLFAIASGSLAATKLPASATQPTATATPKWPAYCYYRGTVNPENPSFMELRMIAETEPFIRAVIDARKNAALNDFWYQPRPRCLEPRHLLEDMFVIDAASVYVGHSFRRMPHLLDGALVTLVVDEHGSTLEPPNVAYNYCHDGEFRISFSKAQLLYCKRWNSATPRSLYGCGLVEQWMRYGPERVVPTPERLEDDLAWLRSTMNKIKGAIEQNA